MSMGDLLVLGVIAVCVIAIMLVTKNNGETEDDFMADDEEPDFTNEYENADANECLAARLKCLELAARGNPDPDDVLKVAEKYWGWIRYEPKAD